MYKFRIWSDVSCGACDTRLIQNEIYIYADEIRPGRQNWQTIEMTTARENI